VRALLLLNIVIMVLKIYGGSLILEKDVGDLLPIPFIKLDSFEKFLIFFISEGGHFFLFLLNTREEIFRT
jgi:hypothetical protein